MGKAKSKEGPSVAGYFRGVFKDRPEWLWEKSNDVILARYREDHGMGPNAAVKSNIKANLANLKSVLRKQSRKKKRAQSAAAHSAQPIMGAVAAPASPAARRLGNGRLETLEELIDDCLTLAKHQDREGLHDVIQMLRRARNTVVWKLGERD
jgi:hypothetical protein